MGVIERMSHLNEGLRARLHGLKILLTEAPTSEFLDAIDELVPSDDEVARWVHTTLASPTGAPKLNVLVLHHGSPVLATTLRARQERWEIATASIAPTLRIPHRDGFLEAALSATRLPILIQDYFGPAEADFRRQSVKRFDSYVLPLNGFDSDAYWRSTKIAADIRQAVRRTAGTAVVHDDRATLDWTIDTWEQRWADDPSDETRASADMRAVWPRLLEMGTVRTTALVAPDGTFVASNVTVADRGTLVGLISARDISLGPSAGSIGTLALVECIKSARASGLSDFDLGGYHAYKRRITPERRVAYEVAVAPRIIAPEHLARARRTAGKAKRKLQGMTAILMRRPSG